MPSLPPRRLTAALIPVLVLATVALAGCGSSSSPGSSTDPADVIPASAPLYLGAVVHPSGTLKTDATTAVPPGWRAFVDCHSNLILEQTD